MILATLGCFSAHCRTPGSALGGAADSARMMRDSSLRSHRDGIRITGFLQECVWSANLNTHIYIYTYIYTHIYIYIYIYISVCVWK